MPDILSDFADAVQRHGLTPPDRVVADGKIHRFRSGPERGLNGFYSLTVLPAHKGGDIGFGLIGCWKRGINDRWCSRDARDITTQDRTALERARERQRAAEEAEAGEAARKAKSIWEGCARAPADHPYLAAKRIRAHGLRLYKGMWSRPSTGPGR